MITGFDHIVICVRDVHATMEFFGNILGLEAREERPGKWSMHFGKNKISLQNFASAPVLAKGTVPGSGNFCLISDTPIEQIIQRLQSADVEIVEGPAKKIGATGRLMSIYFRDPDGNLVEVSNQIS